MKSMTFSLGLRNESNLYFDDEKTDLKERMHGNLESSKVMLTNLQTNYDTQLFIVVCKVLNFKISSRIEKQIEK